MLRAQPAGRTGRGDSSRVGLALAGGGPLGGIYEIGALLALADALDGSRSQRPARVCRGQFRQSDRGGAGQRPEPRRAVSHLHRERLGRASGHARRVPAAGLRRVLPAGGGHAGPAARTLSGSICSIRWSAGCGVRCRAWGRRFLPGCSTARRSSASSPGCSPAAAAPTTSASCRTACTWSPPSWTAASRWSSAPRATMTCPSPRRCRRACALPGLFPPTRIGGRDYVDGALKKTLHASVALREGASLVLCINPLVPFDASLARKHGRAEARQADRRRPAGSAGADLPGADPLAHAGGHGPVRESLRGRRRPAVRAQLGRCRDVLHQRLQLRQPAPGVRPRLPAHPAGDRAAPAASSLRSWRAMASVCAPRFSNQAKPHIKTSPSLRLIAGRGVKTRLDASLSGLDQWLRGQGKGMRERAGSGLTERRAPDRWARTQTHRIDRRALGRWSGGGLARTLPVPGARGQGRRG